MTTITKSDIAEKLAQEIGISVSVCEDIVSKTFEAILDSSLEHKDVHIKNFGGFKVFNKKPRPGRNISKNTEVTIEEKNVVRFSASRTLRHLVNSN